MSASRTLKTACFEKQSDLQEVSPSLPEGAKPAEFQTVERDDWTIYRSINTLPQKAGVPLTRLRRTVLKELTDNALDSGATVVRVGHTEDGYAVVDNGPGIEGSSEDIARMFSIRRPLLSSKIHRMPTR